MKPGDEEALLAGLRALREKTADEGAPLSVEAVLLSEFRRTRVLRNEAKSYRKPLIFIGLAAAAGLVFAFISLHPLPGPVAVQTDVPKKAVVVADPPVPAPPIVATAKPARRKPRRPAARPAPPVVEEVATEFMPMPYAPRFTAEDRGQVVRVRLPRESMRTFGLPVNQDRIFSPVKADVLIGEDGIARAIRFVQ